MLHNVNAGLCAYLCTSVLGSNVFAGKYGSSLELWQLLRLSIVCLA
jgi:hypothetical protein